MCMSVSPALAAGGSGVEAIGPPTGLEDTGVLKDSLRTGMGW